MAVEEYPNTGFAEFGFPKSVLKALDEIGYETPSPIQAQAIPAVMAGRDVLGQAQTGTGKTAAFALPILSLLDPKAVSPQALILVPTRELALQVAEAFQRYASHMKDLHVLPIYGGQAYEGQLRALRRGVDIVVGTPGRVMDHMRRGTLDLSALKVLVLDEADEMLRMGFIDDVKWVLEQTPPGRQTLLFSATMPVQVKKIAQQHLHEPAEITIKVKTSTAETIHQRFWMVGHAHKLDALTRILEFETYDGMLIFVKTKAATVELAEKLQARGHACGALNGDVHQRERERLVENLKKGKLDILVATDVAARGLDVDRISHVINYDIPYDTESYVHRVGRTGRAGRKGEAILFVSPRERGMLAAIEQATKQKIEALKMPTAQDINKRRVAQFKKRIIETLEQGGLEVFQNIVEEFLQENEYAPEQIAAALARMAHGDEPFLLATQKERPFPEEAPDGERTPRKPARGRADDLTAKELYRLEVGSSHGATPKNIVGAIANEAGLDSKYIGQIDIHEDFTIIELPPMPANIFRLLQRVRVAQQRLLISHITRDERPPRPRKAAPAGEFADRPAGDRPAGDRPGGDRPRGPRPAGAGKPGGFKSGASKPGAAKRTPGPRKGTKDNPRHKKAQ
jgi:ATP-dependent RNA helicase DeaD